MILADTGDELKLTKQQAIAYHKAMWHWLAEETLRQKRKTDKGTFIIRWAKEHGVLPHSIHNLCFACEYALRAVTDGSDTCTKCPVLWGKNGKSCNSANALYTEWLMTPYDDYETAAKIAKRIARLPAARKHRREALASKHKEENEKK